MIRPALALAWIVVAVAAECRAQVPLAGFTGPKAQSLFGHDADFAGDVDLDGIADFVVGAYRADVDVYQQGGIAYVYSGADWSLLFTVGGATGLDWLGFAVGGAGDTDGDGRADLMVGAIQQDMGGNTGGYAAIRSGAGGALLFQFPGNAFGQQTGCAVDGAGDVDLDGFADVLVGARFAANGSLAKAGLARIHSGKTGAVLREIRGNEADQWLGWSLCDAGDVDQDGVHDQLIGLAGANTSTFAKAGRARLYSGATGALLHQFDGASSNDVFGYSVAGGADVTGDGVPDLAIGAPNDDTGGSFKGAVRVYSGATFQLLHLKRGDTDFCNFGRDVAFVGDVDQDGRADWMVGAPDDGAVAQSSGLARVFSGSDGSTLASYLGSAKNDLVGSAVAGGADLNGDGRPELLIGGEQTLMLNGFLQLWSSSCGSIAIEGTGCAGTGGFAPQLSATGCITPEGPLAIAIAEALGTDASGSSNLAVVLIGAAAGSQPIGGGCSLLLGAIVGPAVVLPLAGDGAGQGAIELQATIPAGVVGPWTLHLQAFCGDPGAAPGFTASNAVRIHAD